MQQLAVSLVSLAGRSGPNVFQWIGIIIAVAIIAGVLWVVTAVIIVGGHRFGPGAKFLWIVGTLPWPVIGPLVYLLGGRNMRFVKAEVRAQEDAAPVIEPPKTA